MIELTPDELDRNVLHILLRRQGKENAIDRWALVAQIFGEPVPLEKQNDNNPLSHGSCKVSALSLSMKPHPQPLPKSRTDLERGGGRRKRRKE